MNAILASSPNRDFREHAHDLRNLFGAIVSARHLLDDQPEEPRRQQILDAIEEAAQRGGALTTNLLQSASERRRERLDLRARLAGLESMLRATAGSGNLFTLDLGSGDAPIRVAPDRFDHVLIELVANARRALTGPGTIHIRLRNRRGRIRLIVVDSGCGMTGDACHALLTRTPPLGAHGTGFQQIRRFVEEIHGTLRLRSRLGRGTLVAIELPALLRLTR
jgi:signal transduction histidine kinase